MDTREQLMALLIQFQWPGLVAEHLGVSTPTVYAKMASFGITIRYPRHNQRVIRQKIEQIRAEMPDISQRKMAKLIGVSSTTINKIMRTLKQAPSSEWAMSSAESRLRDSLRRLVYPRLVAIELGLNLTTVYERIKQYNLMVPNIDFTEMTLTVLQLLGEKPSTSTQELAQLTGMTCDWICMVLRSEGINRCDISPPPPPPLPPSSSPSSLWSLHYQEAEKVAYEEYQYDHHTALRDLFASQNLI